MKRFADFFVRNPLKGMLMVTIAILATGLLFAMLNNTLGLQLGNTDDPLKPRGTFLGRPVR